MAAAKYTLAKGKNQESVTVGVDTDYDAATGVVIVFDPAVLTKKSEVLRLIREIANAILSLRTY